MRVRGGFSTASVPLATFGWQDCRTIVRCAVPYCRDFSAGVRLIWKPGTVRACQKKHCSLQDVFHFTLEQTLQPPGCFQFYPWTNITASRMFWILPLNIEEQCNSLSGIYHWFKPIMRNHFVGIPSLATQRCRLCVLQWLGIKAPHWVITGCHPLVESACWTSDYLSLVTWFGFRTPSRKRQKIETLPESKTVTTFASMIGRGRCSIDAAAELARDIVSILFQQISSISHIPKVNGRWWWLNVLVFHIFPK